MKTKKPTKVRPLPPRASTVDADQDVRDIARYCARMRAAVERRDVRQVQGLIEVVRGLTYVLVEPSEWRTINTDCYAIEADMENELWESAVRSVDLFTEIVNAAVRAAFARN